MKVKEGQYVRHAQYGWGMVLDCAKHHTTVLFRSIGVKRLAASSAVFANVGGEASRKKPAN